MSRASSDYSAGDDADVDNDGDFEGEDGAFDAHLSSSTSILRGEMVDLPEEKTLHEYFEATVASQRDGSHVADQPAIVNLAESHQPQRADMNVLTFGQLNDFANILARQLRSHVLVAAESSSPSLPSSSFDASVQECRATNQQPVIAIWMVPSEWRVITIMATWKLGAVALILDHSLPDHRILAMCQENHPIAILGSSSQDLEYNSRIENLFRRTKYHLLDIKQLLVQDVEQTSDNLTKDDTLIIVNNKLQSYDPAVGELVSKLAVIIYTSGSTGANKGVCLSHRNLLNRFYWQWLEVEFRPGDCCLSKTSPLFVDFLTETFAPLLEAVRLVIVDKATTVDVRKFLPIVDRQRVTRLVVVPSVLDSIITYLGTLPKSSHGHLRYLKLVICSGEALSHDLALRFFDILPHCTLANFYGSTEVTGDVTYQLLHGQQEVENCTVNYKLSIGQPVYNTYVYLLNDNSVGDSVSMSSAASLSSQAAQSYQLCSSPGQLGAIYISGYNVAQRYISAMNSNSLDQQFELDSFIRNPFLEDPNHPVLYRTGDYGRIVNAKLIYEGRKDGIVKLRGQKVSLAELERAISTQCPSLKGHIVVLQIQLSSENVQLVAFYCQRTSGGFNHLKPSDVVASTRKYMPEHVHFEAFEVDAMPLQPHTGKIDRRALKTMYMNRFQGGTDSKMLMKPSPATAAVAKALCLSGIDELDGSKTFFEMGGNSLNSVLAIAYLSQCGYQNAELERLLSANSLSEFVQSLQKTSQHSSKHAPPPRPSVGPVSATGSTGIYGGYRTVKLHEISAEMFEDIIDMVADSFVRTNPLDVLSATPKEWFATMLRRMWKVFVNDEVSLVCFDHNQTHTPSSPKVVGAMLNLDMATQYDIGDVASNDVPKKVMQINDDVEATVKAELENQGGRYVDFKFVAVANNVNDYSNRVTILNAMESDFLLLAKATHYDGIVTVSSHAATQEIEEKIFGYEVRNVLHVSSYQMADGSRPFSHAPDDYVLKCLVKMLNK